MNIQIFKCILPVVLMFMQQGIFAQPKILLKFDDIGASKNTCNAGPVIDYLLQKQIKASYGVIANRLDSTARQAMEKYLVATNAKGEKLIEIWNHGYTHSNKNPPDNNMEFKGTGYEFQKRHFDSSNMLVEKYLGVRMTSFGSPYNATDSNTIRVIAENGGYKSVMFSTVDTASYPALRFLNNRVDMEKGTGNPNFELFMSDYRKHREYQNSYIVLQGHPPYWNADQFDQFKKIVDFLVAEKCTFVLPAELVR